MEIRLKLDRMNPGMFFAALGTLELLSQQGPNIYSHFEGDGNLVDFIVSSEQAIALPDLKSLSVEALPFYDPSTAPVLVNGMLLDWWLDAYKEESVKSLKLWAGLTTPRAMLRNYQSLMPREFNKDALNFNVTTKTKSAFNFDTRASRDPGVVGYSQKDAGEKSVLYPYTEFLFAIGMQNFRPQLKPLLYFTWARPILTSIAHAACRQSIPGLKSHGFQVTLHMVSQGLREVDAISEITAA